MPRAAIAARTRSGCPAATTPGSVTSSARVTPSRASSQPASSAAPGPNLTGVAEHVPDPAGRRRLVRARLEDGELVAHARVPDVPGAQADLDRVRVGDR